MAFTPNACWVILGLQLAMTISTVSNPLDWLCRGLLGGNQMHMRCIYNMHHASFFL